MEKFNYLKDIDIDENNMAILSSTGAMFQLSETGKDIILQIKSGKNKIDIIDYLVTKYNKSIDEIYIDVEDFMLKLKTLGLYNE